MRRTFGYNTYSDGVLGLSLTCFFRQSSVLVYNKNTITIKQMGYFVHLLNFFGSTKVQAGEAPRDLWGAAPNVRGIYGAPPQTYEGSMGLRPKRTRDLWGTAPYPARFFEKSVGKTMFYRKVSHSLRSRDTLRLFLFYLKLNFSLTDEFMIGKWTRFRKK